MRPSCPVKNEEKTLDGRSREEQKRSKLVQYLLYWYTFPVVSVCVRVFVPLLTELVLNFPLRLAGRPT